MKRSRVGEAAGMDERELKGRWKTMSEAERAAILRAVMKLPVDDRARERFMYWVCAAGQPPIPDIDG